MKISSVIMIAMFILPSCSWYEKTASKSRRTRGTITRTVKGPQGVIPLEVKKPDAGNLALATSPKRQASHQVVTLGRAQLIRGELASALKSFEEAVTLDGSNGIAYYYMARTNYELGEFERAVGLLDRAESLLSDVDAWLITIEALREAITLADHKEREEAL